MTIRISAFRWVPEFAQGYVRDLRVRWALEEAGLAYEATLIGREDTAGDLIMTTVLREFTQSGILEKFPTLDAYRARCEARPAFGRAMNAQLAAFKANAPAAA